MFQVLLQFLYIMYIYMFYHLLFPNKLNNHYFWLVLSRFVAYAMIDDNWYAQIKQVDSQQCCLHHKSYLKSLLILFIMYCSPEGT